MTKFDGIAQGVALYMCWSLAHYVYNINKIHSYCLAKERISVANSRSPSRLCFRHLAAHVHYSRHIKTVTHANYYVVNDVCPTELQTKKKSYKQNSRWERENSELYILDWWPIIVTVMHNFGHNFFDNIFAIFLPFCRWPFDYNIVLTHCFCCCCIYLLLLLQLSTRSSSIQYDTID